MADNVELDPGSGGATIAADDVGGVLIPRSKIVLGADGSNDGDVSAANPLPVTGTVTANLGTLNGAATAAAQATGNAALATLAGAVSGTEMQADVLTLPALPAGSNNIGDVDVLSVPADPFGANADAAVAAGATGSIQAKLRRLTADLDAVKTAAEVLDNIVAGSEAQVDVVSSALPTGASTLAEQQAQTTHLATIIGHVDGVESALGDVVASLDVLDDWDETNRAKVNLIVGQAGVTAGAGAVAANTPRVTLASDDPAVAALEAIDAGKLEEATFTGRIGEVQASPTSNTVLARLKDLLTGIVLAAGANVIGFVNLITGQTGITGGAGNVAANTPRMTLAADDPAVASLATLDNIVAGNEAQVDVITLPALPAGSNNIGDVDVLSMQARYAKAEAGTAIVWGEAGGSGVTNTLSLDALANDAARMGAAVDLGAAWDQEYDVHLWVETGTAPTAGNAAELYLACSYDNTNWPGKVTGSDAAYPATVDANKKQLWSPVVQLVATNDGNTVLKQNPVTWRPSGRYVVPVVVNKLGQAFRDQGTNSNNGSRVILVPRRCKQQDSA